MKKYIVAKRDLISIDDENLQSIECIDSCSTGIDWAWIVPQDGELNGEPVKKGNVVIKFYGRNPDLPSRVCIIREPDVCEHLWLYNSMDSCSSEILDNCEACEPA